ncbi:MAG: HlyC/CorC family transporter [Chloroflexi bacterium]|jgi:putative hemolysin|nr:HlyC/CorC family transporter [Chloroflexota bacterium]
MEQTIGIDLLKLVGVFFLVLANGFFVAAEFALVSVRRTRIAELVAQGNLAARWVQKALENPDRVIAATQLGITLASLGLGWVGEPALSHLLEPLIQLFPIDIQSDVSHSIAAGISFAIITFLHVVVGELAPKSIALQNPEGTSLWVARPTLWTEWIFKPFIWALNGTGNYLLKLVGVEPAEGHELVHSVEELKMLVTASAEGGVVGSEESEMLHAIFNINNLLVRQVMNPRTEVTALEADTSLENSIAVAIESTFSKFPVYQDDLDTILGVVHIRDLLRAQQDPDRKNSTARTLAREALFVPESLPLKNVLQQLRDRRQHIAIVIDEFGGTAGVVTLEDIMEEIIGEVSDPFDSPHPEIQVQADGTVIIEGLALIEEVNEKLELTLDAPHYDTIAGYVLGMLDRMPEIGDSINIGLGLCLKVIKMDGMRIEQLSLSRVEKAPADA